jgi:hypothetical protein
VFRFTDLCETDGAKIDFGEGIASKGSLWEERDGRWFDLALETILRLSLADVVVTIFWGGASLIPSIDFCTNTVELVSIPRFTSDVFVLPDADALFDTFLVIKVLLITDSPLTVCVDESESDWNSLGSPKLSSGRFGVVIFVVKLIPFSRDTSHISKDNRDVVILENDEWCRLLSLIDRADCEVVIGILVLTIVPVFDCVCFLTVTFGSMVNLIFFLAGPSIPFFEIVLGIRGCFCFCL